jgi:Zn-dependent peptidase ImmA (M78 family)/predicted secreted protein
MIDNRTAILIGVKGAHELHRDLGIREQTERSEEWKIDVFSVISRLGATLMFQPLDKLLGAYLPGEENGVLITTQRPLRIQRFTAAHELGHLYLRHEPSLDDEEILRRSPFSGRVMVDRQEREADAFAATFLIPSWLVAILLQRQGWSAASLADPLFAYQASLRLGTSYNATCYSFERHRIIDREQRARLLKVKPQEIKRATLAGYEPSDWRGDVWLLTDQDEGVLIEGGRNDLFVVRLRENSGAGYLWNFDQLKAAGFVLVADDRDEDNDTEKIGGIVTRRVTAQSDDRRHGEVTLREQRPWMPQSPIREFHLRYDLRGPERAGMWEPDLRRLLQAA